MNPGSPAESHGPEEFECKTVVPVCIGHGQIPRTENNHSMGEVKIYLDFLGCRKRQSRVMKIGDQSVAIWRGLKAEQNEEIINSADGELFSISFYYFQNVSPSAKSTETTRTKNGLQQ